MPVIVTKENQQTARLNQSQINKAKDLPGAKTESETLKLALEKVIEGFETKSANGETESVLSDRCRTVCVFNCFARRSLSLPRSFNVG